MEEGKEMKNRKSGLITGDVNSRVVFAGGDGGRVLVTGLGDPLHWS